MLSKLIKYDFKALSRVLWPTMAAVAGASLIATLSFLFTEKSYSSANNGGLATMLGGLLAVVMVLAIIAACFLVFFIICAHFYRNLMTDEGYLTFTLPVKTSEILWSKLITAMLWTIISSVVIGLCVLMFVGLSTAASGNGRQLFAQISDALRQMFALFNTQSALIVFEAVLCVLVMLAFSILHIYLALVIGGVVSHRHKVLAGIGFYFVISIVVSILTAIAQYYFGSSLIGGINGMGSVIFNPQNEIEAANQLVSAAQPYYWFSIGFTAALDVGCFYLSKYFLEKKLNLE